MTNQSDNRMINGLPTADQFRISLDLVWVDGTPRDGGPLLEPILRRLQTAEPYRDQSCECAVAWLRFVRRACNAALQIDHFESSCQKTRVADLRRNLDQRIAEIAETLPPAILARSVTAPAAMVANTMAVWLRSGSKLGFKTWRASVCTWALEDGQAL